VTVSLPGKSISSSADDDNWPHNQFYDLLMMKKKAPSCKPVLEFTVPSGVSHIRSVQFTFDVEKSEATRVLESGKDVWSSINMHAGFVNQCPLAYLTKEEHQEHVINSDSLDALLTDEKK
jgi:hypothetical protein